MATPSTTPPDIRLLALCGSLRRASKNRHALEVARAVAPPGCGVTLHEGLAELPPFSLDLDRGEEHLPPVVAAFRHEVGLADGLLIACPEYAHGIPGAFKNALDWLVGSTSFAGMPVALLNVAPHASHAQAQLREVLRTMSADIFEEASRSIAFPDPAQVGRTEAFAQEIQALLAAYAGALRARHITAPPHQPGPALHGPAR